MHVEEENENWLNQCGQETLKQFERKSLDLVTYISWLKSLPLYYETDYAFISHAGISLKAENPFEESHPESVLWNRGPLKNIWVNCRLSGILLVNQVGRNLIGKAIL